jgi:hypothetical protein
MVLPRSLDWWNGYQQKREQWEKVTVKIRPPAVSASRLVSREKR